MPRTANKNVQQVAESKETKVGCYSMVTSKGKTSWHVALISEGVTTGKAYGHVPLTDDEGEEIVYPTKAWALGFVDGFNFRDKHDVDDIVEEVG